MKETSFVYDPEIMKMVCEEMCAEAGVEFFLHTSVVAAHRAFPAISFPWPVAG